MGASVSRQFLDADDNAAVNVPDEANAAAEQAIKQRTDQAFLSAQSTLGAQIQENSSNVNDGIVKRGLLTKQCKGAFVTQTVRMFELSATGLTWFESKMRPALWRGHVPLHAIRRLELVDAAIFLVSSEAKYRSGATVSLKTLHLRAPSRREAEVWFSLLNKGVSAAQQWRAVKPSQVDRASVSMSETSSVTDRRDRDQYSVSDRRDRDEYSASGRRDRDEYSASGRRDRDEYSASGRRERDEYSASGRRERDEYSASGRREREEYSVSGRRFARPPSSVKSSRSYKAPRGGELRHAEVPLSSASESGRKGSSNSTTLPLHQLSDSSRDQPQVSTDPPPAHLSGGRRRGRSKPTIDTIGIGAAGARVRAADFIVDTNDLAADGAIVNDETAENVHIVNPEQSATDAVDKDPKKRADGDPESALEEALEIVGGSSDWRRGELIGAGSFGKVFLCMNLANGQLFVSKEVPVVRVEASEEVKQLEQEIKLLSSLKHPNIVRYLGTYHDQTECVLSIFLEFMPGGSIADTLKAFGSFEDGMITKYCRDTLQGLSYLHSQEIIHRDIKGQNILVDDKGRCKLADFGACKAIDIENAKASLKGTPAFMAPEAIKTQLFTSACDIWSFGITVIQMATGYPPYAGHENPVAVLLQISGATEPPPIPDTVSDQCREFALLCLNRTPEERPTAKELLEASFLDGTVKRPIAPQVDALIVENNTKLAVHAADPLSLFERIGGNRMVKAAVNILYQKLTADFFLSRFFPNIDVGNQRAMMIGFLTFAFGGPGDLREWDLEKTHQPLNISGAIFDSFGIHFIETLTELGVGEAERGEVAALADTMRSSIVKKKTTNAKPKSMLADAAPAPVKPRASLPEAAKGLFDRIGALRTVKSSEAVLRRRLVADQDMAKVFVDVDIKEFLMFAFGGSAEFVPDLTITNTMFDAFIVHFTSTLDELAVGEAEQAEVLALAESMRIPVTQNSQLIADGTSVAN